MPRARGSTVPATRAGVAIKYVKAVEVTLVPPEND